MNDLRTAAQQALEAMGSVGADWICEASHHAERDQHKIGEPCPLQQRWHVAYQALRAALAEPVLQTCNCRWDGEVQVQQCTLHEAHVDAIKEWAQRAKFAEKKLAEPVQEPNKTSVQQSMQTVREGFGRTMSYLTEVFGVSRQTLYNWLSGEKSPSPEHEGKIHQLEVASQRFMELGFKPSPSQLTRTLAQGKSFLELLAAGGDGATNADKLVNLVQRGQHSRSRLEALLAGVQEPVLNPAPGYCKHCKQYTIEEPLPAEPVQEPVAFAHINGTSDTKWHPPQRKPLTREEAIALWADKSNGPSNGEIVSFTRAIERAHGII